MATIEMHAGRSFRLRTRSDGTRVGVVNFYAFAHGGRPSWWSEEVPLAATAFGVYENRLHVRDGAIVLTEEALAVMSGAESTQVRFDEIERVLLPSKEPLSLTLQVILHSGQVVEVPAFGPEGIAFDLFRFLSSAVKETRARAK